MPPAAPPHPRCVLREGLHLFSPQAPHHAHLATHGADATGPGRTFYPLANVRTETRINVKMLRAGPHLCSHE